MSKANSYRLQEGNLRKAGFKDDPSIIREAELKMPLAAWLRCSRADSRKCNGGGFE
jgi:hypothetical protein